MSELKIGIYPGSFDPITNGHIDIIKRATKLFDKVVVIIAYNQGKNGRFRSEERLLMVEEAIKELNLNNVEAVVYDGLILNYAKSIGAKFIIRGLRVVSDFDYEWAYASANEFIDNTVEMVFLMSKKENTFISSSTVLELASNHVDVSKLVPSKVSEMLKEKFNY